MWEHYTIFHDFKNGKNIKIVLLKFSHNGYFTCLNFFKYYNLQNSAWIKFNYVARKDFNIKVKKLELVEVNYMTPKTIIFSDVNHLLDVK